tara:strand:+ start:1618 stop:2115 length:498 start_codon:yes stop_codon:yes gene_type:complete
LERPESSKCKLLADFFEFTELLRGHVRVTQELKFNVSDTEDIVEALLKKCGEVLKCSRAERFEIITHTFLIAPIIVAAIILQNFLKNGNSHFAVCAIFIVSSNSVIGRTAEYGWRCRTLHVGTIIVTSSRHGTRTVRSLSNVQTAHCQDQSSNHNLHLGRMQTRQ